MMEEKKQHPDPSRQSSSSPVPRARFGDGIREKLITIFIVIKVLPLIALAVFAARQIGVLGDTFKDKSNEMVANTKSLVSETGTLATESSIAALDLKSRENIERLTVDIASKVADFLYARDKDIRYVANLPVDESLYRNFLSVRTKEVVYHPDWVLSEDGARWQPPTKATGQPHTVEPGSPDNQKDFHYQPPHHSAITRTQPLYHEMTFVGLDGQERLKISATGLLQPGLRNIARKENTWCKAETYFAELAKLRAGDIYVSRVIGEYIPSPIIGPYTPERAEKAGIPFAPEKAGYGGKENPVGQRFQGVIRWATPVFNGAEKIGYVTLALDHTHLMEFTDHVVPTDERYSDISDAGSGNYAFMWDDQGRNISHPRDYFIVGFDRETGEQAVPWLSAELFELWQSVGGSFSEFEQIAPSFQGQTNVKKPAASLTKEGMLGLDCRYLNFAPQCIGWYNLTQHGGSGSFLILWSGLWKLTTAAAIPYHTGIYGNSPRGFGFVTIGANVDEFHSSATETAGRITAITKEYETGLEKNRLDTLSLIEQRLRATLTNLSVSTGIMVVLVILVAIWMAATLTGKITAIIQGIKQFQSGQMASRLQVKSRDELGELAGAFNEMADQLQQSMLGIREAKERAEESDRAKSLFLANMSHEIRTPMNAILGMTHLAMEASTSDQRRNLLQTVEHSAESLLRLLDDILDFSKMEAGQLQLNEAPFDLRHLIAGVLSIMHVPATEKGLRLESILPEHLPLCFLGDELRLRQILLNLVNNGIKFTDTGSITIRVAVEDEAIKAGAAGVHFVIIDTGVGVSEEKLPLIFNRFEQADNSYARQYGGVGLGLSICQQLAALMGGRIWVESLRDLGSTFHVVVPLRRCEEEALAVKTTAKAGEGKTLKGLRVLVVDDNEVNRDVASMTLARDHAVTGAANGIEALMHLAAEAFDVVLMDVQMPVMDGLTASGVIRAAEQGLPLSVALPGTAAQALTRKLQGKHLPIVAMTAHALGGDREMCLQAGMDAYLTKPFQPGQLNEVLMTILAAAPVIQEQKMKPVEERTMTLETRSLPSEPKLEQVRTYLQTATLLKPEQIERILAAARQSITNNLALAAEALEQQDYQGLGRAAHTLKGTLLQCGLAEWAEKAQEVHSGVKDNRDLPFFEMVETLKRGMGDLLNKEDDRLFS